MVTGQDHVLHPVVQCDSTKWLPIPTDWSGRYRSAKEWADAEAPRRWDTWHAQHPKSEYPGSAVDRTALELQIYADRYGGLGDARPRARTYLYLPDPTANAFLLHIGVDETAGLTIEGVIDQIGADEAPQVQDFTTQALGTGRKVKARGILEPRPTDPAEQPGVWASACYIFTVSDPPGMVVVRATDSDPARIDAADGDLDEFVRGVSLSDTAPTDDASDPLLDTGAPFVNALDLVAAVGTRRAWAAAVSACLFAPAVWFGAAVLVSIGVPRAYNLRWRIVDDMAAGILLIVLVGFLTAMGAGAQQTKSPYRSTITELVPVLSYRKIPATPEFVEGEEVAPALDRMLRREPLAGFGAALIGLASLGAVVVGLTCLPLAWSIARGNGEVVTIGQNAQLGRADYDAVKILHYLNTSHGEVLTRSGRIPEVGERWLVRGHDAYIVGGHGYVALSILVAVGVAGLVGTTRSAFAWIRTERNHLAAAGETRQMVQALAGGRRVVMRFYGRPGETVLGLPPGDWAPPRELPWRARGALIGFMCLSLTAGAVARYGGRFEPGTSAERSAMETSASPTPASLPDLPGARHATLAYLKAAAWKPNADIFDVAHVGADIQFALRRAGVQTSEFGLGWRVQLNSASGSTNEYLDALHTDVLAQITVVAIGTTPCDRAAAIAVQPPDEAEELATLPGLPVGWQGSRATYLGQPLVVVAACRAGTLLFGRFSTLHVGVTPPEVIGGATRLASAIEHRGIAKFYADTAPPLSGTR